MIEVFNANPRLHFIDERNDERNMQGFMYGLKWVELLGQLNQGSRGRPS